MYWELGLKYGVKCTDVWYKEVPADVRLSKNGTLEICWDRSIKTTQKMEHTV